MANANPPAPDAQHPPHVASECVACRIVDRLSHYHEGLYPGAPERRAALGTAILLAKRECPEHRRAWAVDA